MSEIDDIFASRGKIEAVLPIAPDSARVPAKKKKKDKKKRNRQDKPQEHRLPAKKSPSPETIVDPSTQPTKTKRSRKDNDTITPSKRSRSSTESKDEKHFKDSRGTGPQRKTEEGWNIYKEDELGLANRGGDTPLCPFDCDCCF